MSPVVDPAAEAAPHDATAALIDMVAWQADACRVNHSPLYTELLHGVATELAAGTGPWLDLLVPYANEPVGAAVALRLMGAVHRLVLDGRAPALAAHYYPPTDGAAAGDPNGAWPTFRATVIEHADTVARHLPDPVQTNEVGRSAALVGGFLLVAALGLPLRILEIGASAGLNLRWDCYRYQARNRWWGREDAALVFPNAIDGRPPFGQPAVVVERRGCDLRPLDPSREEDRLTLRAYVWPDTVQRHRRLDAAFAVAAAVPATVERADAVDWLAARLDDRVVGVTTVVYHSIFIQYLPATARRQLRACLEEAGRRATADAPLAWLRMEPGRRRNRADVQLRLWPGNGDRLLAHSGYHGPPVSWVG